MAMAQSPEMDLRPAAGELPGRVLAEPRTDGLRALYTEHADFVRSAVIRLGGPHVDADDLVHDVFVVALRKLPEFAGRSAVTTWLYGIAIKVVADARRKAKLRRFLGLDAAPEPIGGRTPAELFEHREASVTLYRILDGLGEKKRAAFILYEIEGLSGEEIAEAVDCPLKTVWTRLHHARREVSAALGREAARASRELSGTRRGP